MQRRVSRRAAAAMRILVRQFQDPHLQGNVTSVRDHSLMEGLLFDRTKYYL